MKRALVLSLFFLLFPAIITTAFADEITFTVVGPGTITSSLSGMTAGPAMVPLVTDVTTGKSFPLTDTFTASAGAAHSVTVGATSYTAFFAPGATGSVSIPGGVTGNMLDNSELTAVIPDGAGSFSGEFDVTFLSPTILAEFGLGPHWAPTGSVGITFHESALNGHSLTGNIGGGSTTVLTVQTAVPEPETWAMFLFGCGTLVAFWHSRQNLRS
jgi:hypothetical protein